MGFHEVLLPTNVDYGSSGGPSFDVQITRLDSGSEERNLRWAAELAEYDASYGVKALEDLHLILRFFRARRGAAYGFRYKDFHDFTSTNDGRSAPTNADQVIGTGDGVTASFQLIKRYGDINVATPYVRPITKPAHGSIRQGDGADVVVFDTVLVAVDGVAQTEGVDFTIDETTGVVLLTSAPALGLEVTAGFQFHVPVRFDIPKAALQASIDAFDSSSTTSAIPLVELRADDVGVREDYFYGDNLDIENLLTDTVLPIFKRSIRVRACNGTANLLLLDPTSATGKRIQPGVVHHAIFNHDLTNSLEVRDHGDNLVATIGPQSGKTINLASNLIDATFKRYILTDVDTAPALPFPWDTINDENKDLSETTIAEGVVEHGYSSLTGGEYGFITPAGLPGLQSWADDVGGEFSFEVTNFNKLIQVLSIETFRMNAAGDTILETGASVVSPADITSDGVFTWTIPAHTWVGPINQSDRLLVSIGVHGSPGGTTVVHFKTGITTTYFDTSLQDPPRLLQWLAF